MYQQEKKFVVYALYSERYEKIYIGRSSNLNQRMISHNEKGTKGWTAKFRPWTLVYTEEFDHKHDSIQREKELKSAKGRAFIWELIRKRNEE
jgi:putative endonuclease